MNKLVKWIVIIIGLVIGLPLAGFIILMGTAIVGYRQNGEPPDFTGYKTDMPLAGSTIVKDRVRKGYPDAPKPSSSSYEQIYDSGVEVVQFKKSGSSSDIVCDPVEVERYTNECKRGDIDGGVYAVTVIYYDGELFHIKVSAVIDGTQMYLVVPDSAEKQVAEYTEWQHFFNSMRPIDLNA